MRKLRSEGNTNLCLWLDILNLTFDFISHINLKTQRCPSSGVCIKCLLEQLKIMEQTYICVLGTETLRGPW